MNATTNTPHLATAPASAHTAGLPSGSHSNVRGSPTKRAPVFSRRDLWLSALGVYGLTTFAALILITPLYGVIVSSLADAPGGLDTLWSTEGAALSDLVRRLRRDTVALSIPALLCVGVWLAISPLIQQTWLAFMVGDADNAASAIRAGFRRYLSACLVSLAAAPAYGLAFAALIGGPSVARVLLNSDANEHARGVATALCVFPGLVLLLGAHVFHDVSRAGLSVLTAKDSLLRAARLTLRARVVPFALAAFLLATCFHLSASAIGNALSGGGFALAAVMVLGQQSLSYAAVVVRGAWLLYAAERTRHSTD